MALTFPRKVLPLLPWLPKFTSTYFMNVAEPHYEEFLEDHPIQRNCTTCVHRKKNIHGTNVCTKFAPVLKGEYAQYQHCDQAFENLCRGVFWFADY